MKFTAGAFVVTNSCSPSVDMLGGCERGCGNDRAHAGVGFGSLSIRFEGKEEVNQCKSFIRANSSNSSNSSNYTGRLANILSPSFHYHHAPALSDFEKNRSLR